MAWRTQCEVAERSTLECPAVRSTKESVVQVRAKGLEPPRAFAHQDLNLARLPVPPRPRSGQRTASQRTPDAPVAGAMAGDVWAWQVLWVAWDLNPEPWA